MVIIIYTTTMLSRTSHIVIRSSAARGSSNPAAGIAISPSIHHLRPVSNSRFSQREPSRLITDLRKPPRSELSYRTFCSSQVSRKGLSPHSTEPPPPNPEPHVVSRTGQVLEATNLTDGEYHNVSEHYLNILMAELEKVQEEGSEIEAEYSVS